MRLAQHDSLVAARQRIDEENHLFAFLDDLYVVTTRERARAAFDAVTEEVSKGAGVRTHLGKLRLWSKAGGACPPGFEAFEGDVWTGNAATEKQGIKVLGTPLGHADFVAAHAQRRMAEDSCFLAKITALGRSVRQAAAAYTLWGATSKPPGACPSS